MLSFFVCCKQCRVCELQNAVRWNSSGATRDKDETFPSCQNKWMYLHFHKSSQTVQITKRVFTNISKYCDRPCGNTYCEQDWLVTFENWRKYLAACYDLCTGNLDVCFPAIRWHFSVNISTSSPRLWGSHRWTTNLRNKFCFNVACIHTVLHSYHESQRDALLLRFIS